LPTRAGLPVLMLTARAEDAYRLASLNVGVDDCLAKAFVPAELLAEETPPALHPPPRLSIQPCPQPVRRGPASST
jgi:CheY-like chemotaxis protein